MLWLKEINYTLACLCNIEKLYYELKCFVVVVCGTEWL